MDCIHLSYMFTDCLGQQLFYYSGLKQYIISGFPLFFLSLLQFKLYVHLFSLKFWFQFLKYYPHWCLKSRISMLFNKLHLDTKTNLQPRHTQQQHTEESDSWLFWQSSFRSCVKERVRNWENRRANDAQRGDFPVQSENQLGLMSPRGEWRENIQ